MKIEFRKFDEMVHCNQTIWWYHSQNLVMKFQEGCMYVWRNCWFEPAVVVRLIYLRVPKVSGVNACERPRVRDEAKQLWNLQATCKIWVSSSTPPGNLGFSARQVSSLPSSSLLRTNAILLTVELLLWVVIGLGFLITSPSSRQTILAAGELPQVSHRTVTGRPAWIWSSVKMIFITAGFTATNI